MTILVMLDISPDITHNKVNNCRMLAILSSIKSNFFRAYVFLKPHILFYTYSNGTAIWHGFPDITHIKVNHGCKYAIFNLIRLKNFQAYSSLKLHILFYSTKIVTITHVTDSIESINITTTKQLIVRSSTLLKS